MATPDILTRDDNALQNNTSLAKVFELQAIDAALRAKCVSLALQTYSTSLNIARKANEINLQRMIDEKNGKMWVIEGFEKLKTPQGNGQCPGIVQGYGHLPLAKYWFAGPKVRGINVIPYGTAIATFVDGRYQNLAHGNHVAIYIDQDAVKGLLVFDQWTNMPPHYRWMAWGDGFTDRSNDGSAMSIILTPKDL